MLAGVCGGLARYFDIHPAFYRVGFVVLTLLGGAGILIYLAAALVIPKRASADSVASAALRNRRERPWPLIGARACSQSRAPTCSRGRRSGRRRRLGAAPARGRVRSSGSPADSTAATAEGTLAARTRVGSDASSASRLRSQLLALLLIVAAAIFAADVPRAPGKRCRRPHLRSRGNVQDLRHSYKLGIGDMRVDLSDVRLPAGETHVKARVDVGNLTRRRPAQRRAAGARRRAGGPRSTSSASIGRRHRRRRSRSSETGKRVLVLDAHVGAGKLERHARRTVSRACRCPPSTTSADERVIAGVCAGIAQALGVDVTLVRLVFALLALAGGAGIVLYLALWAWSAAKRPGGRRCSSSSPARAPARRSASPTRGVVGIALDRRRLALALAAGRQASGPTRRCRRRPRARWRRRR